MADPRVVVVGLGPSGADQLAPAARSLLTAEPSRSILRTGRHPAAEALGDLETFDAAYESAGSFEEVYDGIVAELVRRAAAEGEVVYGVPGSPLVAERTVELLRSVAGIELVVVPAVSFADLAAAAAGIDPMAEQLRIVDALSIGGRLRGPGPILLAQCHSQAVLSEVKLSIDADLQPERPRALVLHHLGLPDEQVLELDIDQLDGFEAADHLTSVLIPELRTAGQAAEDLVDLMATLRAECPWDREQTHGSLGRHLLEESYEALEAIEALAERIDADGDEAFLAAAYEHVAEELGDLLFQVVFHAELAAEDGRFDLTAVMDGVRTKLVGRHPHVFGDVEADTPDEVAANWEQIKQAEKGRESVTDGIPLALPSLQRYVKLRRKAAAIGIDVPDALASLEQLRIALAAVEPDAGQASDAAAATAGPRSEQAAALLAAAADLSAAMGIDPEAALRRRADELRSRIVAVEAEQAR